MSVLEKECEPKGSMSKVKKLMGDFNDLMNKHIELVSYEIKNETLLTGKILLAIVLSVIVAYTGFLFAGLFLVLVLGIFMPIVVAAMTVTALYAVSSLVLLLMAKKYLGEIREGKESMKSQVTQTMEHTKKWLTDFK